MQLNIELSRHAKNRASKRGISIDQINMCIQHGEELYKTGSLFFFMTDKCLKKLKKIYGGYLSKLQGLVVLTCTNEDSLLVVTVYKDKKAMKVIRKKQSYNKRSNYHAEYYC
tara:strand:- start:742 stop:1077 length:336 start_codon:yes stop_codon:yes gene_type:complete